MIKTAWVISPPSKGSGGFRTICSKAAYLDKHGYECHFFILPGSEEYKCAEIVAEQIHRWFGYDPKSIEIRDSIPCSFDIAIATAWNTAAFVALQPVSQKLYFIQDYEPWFYPMGESYLLAEQSYRLGLKPITIGRWLSSKISQYYPYDVPFCDFGVDSEHYHSNGVSREPKSICAIFQPNKDRRLSNLLLNAIKLSCSYDSDLMFYLFGSDQKVNLDMRRVKQLGVLSVSECAELYSHCQVGISLSATNPSRLPFEMLASGLSVVEISGDNTAFDFNASNISYADSSAVGIASALFEALGKSNVAPTNLISVDVENQMFLDAITDYINEDCTNKSSATPRINKSSSISAIPDLVNLSQEMELLNYRIAADSQQVVCANHFHAILNIPGNQQRQSIFRVAYWLRSDQSDLQWCELHDSDDGLYVDLDFDAPSEDTALLHIHIYKFSLDNSESLFLGEFKQLVSTKFCDVVAPFARELDFGSYHFHIEFSQSLQESGESESGSFASHIKRFIGRK